VPNCWLLVQLDGGATLDQREARSESVNSLIRQNSGTEVERLDAVLKVLIGRGALLLREVCKLKSKKTYGQF
jgi:hypothetical protein